MAAHELLFIVDEFDTPLPPLTREEVHRRGDVWHRTSAILIFNSRGQLLCSQRSLTVDKNPGQWAFGFGGHVNHQEEVLDNALRELEEELGLMTTPEALRFFTKVMDPDSMHAEYIYFFNTDADVRHFQPNAEEVAALQWLHPAEVVTRSKTKEFSFPLYEQVRAYLGLH